MKKYANNTQRKFFCMNRQKIVKFLCAVCLVSVIGAKEYSSEASQPVNMLATEAVDVSFTITQSTVALADRMIDFAGIHKIEHSEQISRPTVNTMIS